MNEEKDFNKLEADLIGFLKMIRDDCASVDAEIKALQAKREALRFTNDALRNLLARNGGAE